VSVRVDYNRNVAPELRAALAPVLARWEWLLPGWVHQVCVSYDGTAKDEQMATQVEPEYRRVALIVGPHWLGISRSDRESCVRHEYLHATVNPLVNVGDDAVKCAKGPKRAALSEELRRAVEGAVCDLEALVLRAMERGEAAPVARRR
jgi:hypothetical protein